MNRFVWKWRYELQKQVKHICMLSKLMWNKFWIQICSHKKTWLVCMTPIFELVPTNIILHALLISGGAILNIQFMTSFAESNLSSCADFITLDTCMFDRSTPNFIVKRRLQERSVSFLAPYETKKNYKKKINITWDKTEKITFLLGSKWSHLCRSLV